LSKGTAIDLGLTGAYNDLFSTQAERDNAQRSYVIDLPIAEISDFPDHLFKVRMLSVPGYSFCTRFPLLSSI
jgi:ParB family chromosome partitioning protein